jgi:hypothetical protein
VARVCAGTGEGGDEWGGTGACLCERGWRFDLGPGYLGPHGTEGPGKRAVGERRA